MILKPEALQGAAPEALKEIEALSANLQKAGWDLYPCKVLEGGKFLIQPYRQLHTEQGDWEGLKSNIPASLVHLGKGVFEFKKAK